jgi:hypothetical protein
MAGLGFMVLFLQMLENHKSAWSNNKEASHWVQQVGRCAEADDGAIKVLAFLCLVFLEAEVYLHFHVAYDCSRMFKALYKENKTALWKPTSGHVESDSVLLYLHFLDLHHLTGYVFS